MKAQGTDICIRVPGRSSAVEWTGDVRDGATTVWKEGKLRWVLLPSMPSASWTRLQQKKK